MLVCLLKTTYIALPSPGGEEVLKWLAVPCPEASTFMSTSDCLAAVMNACVVSMQTMLHTQFICCTEAAFTTTVWSCTESTVALSPLQTAVCGPSLPPHVLALHMLESLQHLASTPAPPLPPSHTFGGCVRMPATAGALPGHACTKKNWLKLSPVACYSRCLPRTCRGKKTKAFFFCLRACAPWRR